MAKTETQKHDKIATDLEAKFGAAILDVDRSFDDLSVTVDKAAVHDVLAHLKNEKNFNLLLDVVGVDCLELEDHKDRFEVNYVLYAIDDDVRMRVRVTMPESDLAVPTVTDLWRSANWGEREAFEFFGFEFVGHPNLKRLLTHHEFQGHPLRKDYPVMGGQWCTTTPQLDEELNE